MEVKSEENLTLVHREKVIREILSVKKDDFVSSDEIRQMWATYLQENLPSCPWVAFYRPLNQPVDVVEIDSESFQARFELLKEDNKNEEFIAELKDLFPVSVEEEDKVKIKEANSALGHFRFFLTNLWFPWDEDCDATDEGRGNWITDHLSSRFLLLDCDVGYTEGFVKLKKMCRDYQEISQKLRDCNAAENLQLEQKLEGIPKLALVVENPATYDEYKTQLRQAKERHRLFDIDRGYSIDRQAVLVWPGGKLSNLHEFLGEAKSQIPFDDAHIILKDSLQAAIDCCIPNDVIILGPGEYILDDLGDLATCLSIIGIARDARKTKIVLDCGFGYEIVIQGPGSICNLKNLTILSKGGQSGIWIRNGAALYLRDCRLLGFHNAVRISDDESKGVLKYNEIQTCHSAFEIKNGGQLHVVGGLIEDCEVGIVAESFTNELHDIHLDEVDNYAKNKYDIKVPIGPKVVVNFPDN